MIRKKETISTIAGHKLGGNTADGPVSGTTEMTPLQEHPQRNELLSIAFQLIF